MGDSIDAVIQVSLLPSILGVDELDGEIVDVSVTPNPAKDQLNFNFMMKSTGEAAFKIYDTSGQLVYESQKLFSAGNQTWTIDSNFLNAGIYHFDLHIPGGSKSDLFVVVK